MTSSQKSLKMELEKTRDIGTAGPLDRIGKFSSLLIKDSLRIARLAFVDVSAAELMTEDATNTEEEWGPTTKTMAAIADASKSYDDYVRILHVLRGRLSLPVKKKWRQIFKALTVMEYLLTHGPEQFIMDFRDDKKRVEELTRFSVFLDENLFDRGSALQSKAKQVIQLLVDEKFIKEQRRRAQTVSKGILGFGSQSLPKAEFVRTELQKCNTHSGAFRSDHGISDQEPSSPIPQRVSSSKCRADDSPQMSSASTDWNPFDDSPSSSSSSDSVNGCSPIEGAWAPPLRDTSSARSIKVDLELRSTADSQQQQQCRVPPPPPGGSKVGSLRSSSLPIPSSHSVPDLILM